MAIRIKRGDAFSLEIDLKLASGAVAPEEVETAEFTLGSLRKLCPGEVTYDSGTGTYFFPVSQEESFALPEEGTFFDIRVKLAGGGVTGLACPIPVYVAKSVSEAVL